MFTNFLTLVKSEVRLVTRNTIFNFKKTVSFLKLPKFNLYFWMHNCKSIVHTRCSSSHYRYLDFFFANVSISNYRLTQGFPNCEPLRRGMYVGARAPRISWPSNYISEITGFFRWKYQNLNKRPTCRIDNGGLYSINYIRRSI